MKNEALYKSFENIPSRRGRGGTYSYIRWQDVADRMNEVFGTDWSSEVMFQNESEDKVIVRVKVSIFNSKTGRHMCQEGFGGAPNDAASEAGNPFKAAYSKALKDACKKWGVALYLEEEPDGPGHMTPSPLPPGYSGKEYGVPPKQEIPQAAIPASAPTPVMTGGLPMPPSVSMPTPGQIVQETIVVHQEPKSVPVAPSAPIISSTPTIPAPMAPPVQTHTVSTPIPPMSGGLPTPPQVSLKDDMPMSKTTTISTGEPEKISDVQKAALHGILSYKDVEYESLAREAFEFNGVHKDIIPPADDLTYQEAVYVVKYGNDKFRRR